MKTAKPQKSSSKVFQNDSVAASATPEKLSPGVSVDDAVDTTNKIDINDHAALQEAFNKIRKPGATDDDPGEPGDFDGKEGLEA